MFLFGFFEVELAPVQDGFRFADGQFVRPVEFCTKHPIAVAVVLSLRLVLNHGDGKKARYEDRKLYQVIPETFGLSLVG